VSEHTSQVEWVRAAIRDELGLTDEGGVVNMTPDMLTLVAMVAIREHANYLVAAGKEGLIETAGGDDE
jgi:hypothetical protein